MLEDEKIPRLEGVIGDETVPAALDDDVAADAIDLYVYRPRSPAGTPQNDAPVDVG